MLNDSRFLSRYDKQMPDGCFLFSREIDSKREAIVKREVRLSAVSNDIEILFFDEKGGECRRVVEVENGSHLISHVLNHLRLNKVTHMKDYKPGRISKEAEEICSRVCSGNELEHSEDVMLLSMRRYDYLLKRCFPIKDVFEIEEIHRLAESFNGCIFEPNHIVLIAGNLEDYFDSTSQDEWSEDDKILLEKVCRSNEYERLHLVDSLERLWIAPDFEKAAYELELLSGPKAEPMERLF